MLATALQAAPDYPAGSNTTSSSTLLQPEIIEMLVFLFFRLNFYLESEFGQNPSKSRIINSITAWSVRSGLVALNHRQEKKKEKTPQNVLRTKTIFSSIFGEKNKNKKIKWLKLVKLSSNKKWCLFLTLLTVLWEWVINIFLCVYAR